MNRQKFILAFLALALIGATAVELFHLQTHQRLGDPGVKTRPQANGKNLEILMPETVPGFSSEILTNLEDATLAVLPSDTSCRTRMYLAPDDFQVQITTVLMGSDRSSIHSPQICLPGQGWTINDSQTRVVNIPMTRPLTYDLPVKKMEGIKQVQNADGTVSTSSCVYLYWFVDGNQYTASEWRRKAWLVPHDLLTTGVLDRWACIACFSPCVPGNEDATFERMKKMIADTVPEFQLVPYAAK